MVNRRIKKGYRHLETDSDTNNIHMRIEEIKIMFKKGSEAKIWEEFSEVAIQLGLIDG